jgi:hypothetical protein
VLITIFRAKGDKVKGTWQYCKMDFIICTGHTTGFDSLNQEELHGKGMY